MDYQFRAATFNGFNREDVIAFLESTDQAHKSRIDRLQSKIAGLEADLDKEKEKQRELIDKLSEQEAENSRIKIESGVKIADLEDEDSEEAQELLALREELAKSKSLLENNQQTMESIEDTHSKKIDDLEEQLRKAIVEAGHSGDDSALQEENDDLKEDVARLEKELAKAKKKGSDSDAIQDLEDEIDELEDEIDELKEKLEKATKSSKKSKDGDEDSQEEIKRLTKQVSDLEDELKDVTKQLEEGGGSSSSDSGNSGGSGGAVSSSGSTLEELEIEIDGLYDVIEKTKKELAEARSGGGSSEGGSGNNEEVEELRNQVDELQEELKKAKLAGGGENSEEVEQEINDLYDQIANLKKQLAEANSGTSDGNETPPTSEHSEENEDALPSHTAANEELEEEIEALHEEIAQLKDALADMEDQLAHHEDRPDSSGGEDLTEELERVKDLLQKAQERILDLVHTVQELEDDLAEKEDEFLKLNQQDSSPTSAPQLVVAPPPVEVFAPPVSNQTLDAAKLEISSLTLQLREAEDRAFDAEEKLGSMSQTISDLEFTAQGYDARTQQLLSRLENAERENKRLISSQQVVDEMHLTLNATKSDYEKIVADLRTQLSKAKEDSEALLDCEEELEDLNRKLSKAQEKLTDATEVEKDLKTQIDGLTNELEELEAAAKEANDSEETLAELADLKEKLQKAQEELSLLASLEDQLAKANEALEKLHETEEQLKEANIHLEELDALESDLELAMDKLDALSGLEVQLDSVKTELTSTKEELSSTKEQLDASQTSLTQSERKLDDAQESNRSLKSQLDEAHEELHSIPRLRTQLRESQEELESMSKIKSQLRDARDELEVLPKLKLQLVEAHEELENATKYKVQLRESKEEQDILETKTKEAQASVAELTSKIEELEERLTLKDSQMSEVSDSAHSEKTNLSQTISDLELSLDDEKRANATLITELDELREELTRRKNTEWSLTESLEKMQLNHDVFENKVKRLEPAAKAYLNIKDRVASMEREAQFRAQETIHQAETEVFRVQQQVEQWLARVNTSYSSLCKELDDNISSVDQGLSRATTALAQINSVIKTQDSAFIQLGRTISSSSQVTMPPQEPTEVEQVEEVDAVEPSPENWQSETWTAPVPPNNTTEWVTPGWSQTPPQNPPEGNWGPTVTNVNVTENEWSTATIPNSASPADWSAAPSPLPVDDYPRNKPLDLYEELEALDDFDE